MAGEEGHADADGAIGDPKGFCADIGATVDRVAAALVDVPHV